MLDIAIKLASEKHCGQFDKGGKPYILHPLRLMMRLRTEDSELMQLAVLHDVVGDSGVTFEDLSAMRFSLRVISALICLTHIEGEKYDDYILRICENEDAVRIKLEDLKDNSDITRLKGVRPKDLVRIEKYNRSYLICRDLYSTRRCANSKWS